MRVLLLGATGFASKYLLTKLSENPELSITAVIHSRQPDTVHNNVIYVTAGLNEITYDFLEKGEYDTIFHLARISGKRFRDIGRLYAGLQGYMANQNLLKSIYKLDKKPRLVYLSGSLMYGNNPGKLINEDHPLNPAGFGKFYYYTEKPILDAVGKPGYDILMLRAPWILGNGSWFRQLYLNNMHKNGEVPAYGNMFRYMSIIPVEDCANMLWHYAQHADKGVYNIYTYAAVRYTDFVSSLQSVYNMPLKHYTEEEMKSHMDNTMIRSICSEIVLTTIHKQLLESCRIDFPDLKTYIRNLATQL